MIFQRVANRPIHYFFRLFGLCWIGFMCLSLYNGLIHFSPFSSAAWVGACFGALLPAAVYSLALVFVCGVLTLTCWAVSKLV